ncbi:hypothetical protein [Prauserella muralis]|uniref:Uncharacterized protein n=1 Tax=Prauserella muralis TaxID=588067 RepID=A0A2V4BB90_9PSEU|nr:hypothetical protein [Prauserella muralis]PXY32520.1 hypothetical protein BAY60_09725 [Prauserella muralis]TWE23774.1 hypothetical protein FHX69_5074 [Prauserella muralis]
MAKKWGKRGKSGRQDPGLDADPRTMFGVPSAPRNAPPASSTPLADYLRRGWPGVEAGYVVLPRSLAESMPLPWQQQMTNLLAQFHETHGRLSWPTYRVVPSRPERLVDLDEEQLAEAGYLVEIDGDGEMVYRERSGRKVEDPDNTTVLVSCLDPIVRQVEQARAQAQAAQPGGPAPMNIGPQPVWRTTPQPAQPAAPPLPPPPTARSVAGSAGQRPAASPLPEQPVQRPEPGPAAEPPAVDQPAPEQPAERAPVSEQRSAPEPRAAAESERRERGWFDEMPGEGGGRRTEPGGGEFGPTGDEPTEIPYRYRP